MKATLCNQTLNPNKVRLPRGLNLFLLGLWLAGCSGKQQTPETVSQGKVVLKGSNTIGEELAPRLIAEYKKERPGVEVDLESKGTGSGFTALLAGECDIAGASRVVTTEELSQAVTRGIDYNVHVIGSYS